MGSAPFIEPTNKIVVAGSNVDRRGYTTSGTVTNLIPGRLVKKGASDSLIIIGDVDGPNIGWLGYEDAFGPDKPVNITTAYATAKNCDVLSGPGTILVANSETAAVTKGDLLCAGSDGKVRKLYPGAIKTMVIPFTNSEAAEADTGYELPAGAVLIGMPFVEVVTNVADATIDVGILSTEASGDADGFLDGVSCATAGKIQAITYDASAVTNITLGALLSSDLVEDVAAGYGAILKQWVGDGTATTVSYTTNDKAIVGNIHIMYCEPGVNDMPVGIAEETIAAAGNLIIRSLI